jgi:ATP-dependent Clp protease adaptor protein ClpS
MSKPIWKQEEDTIVESETEKAPAIIVYNDDYNTFEHVIECLIKYCKHEPEQASQCAHLVHYKGKCDVKHGTYEELRPIYEALLDNHLSVKIEI